jgi:hypothetical protein
MKLLDFVAELVDLLGQGGIRTIPQTARAPTDTDRPGQAEPRLPLPPN